MTDNGGIEPSDNPTRDPTISCQRCGRTWDLGFELDVLNVGNQAVEQFALDHKRHTGHFPDEISTWITRCRNCPDGDTFLSRSMAERWAETHGRHTTHEVQIDHESLETPVIVSGPVSNA